MRTLRDNSRRLGFLATLTATAAMLLCVAASASAAEPVWRITSVGDSVAASDGNLETTDHIYRTYVENTGNAAAEDGVAPLELQADLPAGFTVVSVQPPGSTGWECPTATLGASSFSCVWPGGIYPAHSLLEGAGFSDFAINVSVDSSAAPLSTAQFTVSGGGAQPASTADPTLVGAGPAGFGIDAFDVGLLDSSGAPFTQAGGHPYAYTTSLAFNTHTEPGPAAPGLILDARPVEPTRDFLAELPPGLIGNVAAFPQCTAGELGAQDPSHGINGPLCPPASQLGTTIVRVTGDRTIHLYDVAVFNMAPGPGVAARFGFNVNKSLITLDARLRSHGDYGLTVGSRNTSEGVTVEGGSLTIWGTPGSHAHDTERSCPGHGSPIDDGPSTSLPGVENGEEKPACPESFSQVPFLRMPTSCTAAGQGLPFTLRANSWVHPGAYEPSGLPDLSDPAWKSRSIHTHEALGYPYAESEWGPQSGVTGCDQVPVKGNLSAKPTAIEAETSSGLGVHVEVPNPGLTLPDRIASSDIKDVKVTLPQGMTINPSQASGLGVCSAAQYASTEVSFHPDGSKGCPSDSKIGTVEAHTQLLEETLPGNVYVAKPYDNPFNSLLAIYIVIEEPQRGVLVKLPGELRLNETTGRIEAEFANLPQVPFETFDFHFREGARAPLVTPPTCGTYTTEAEIEGWSDPGHPIESDSSFEITRGIGGGPCPPGGTPAFKPLFSAGSINNNAGSFSPFNMRIQRSDGEQDMTRFSAVLPPGVLGKLAGVERCPITAIGVAKAKSGVQEQQSPSCPAGSLIGHSIVGAGVGSVLTYVPGKVYLGGPFGGDPLSVIAITPVVAGPFDVGTVAVHEALTLNPKTAEVEVDGSASDPIPHILKGIPAKLRDLRVYVDRPDFTLNPTNCDPSSARATLFGGGANAFTTLDDVPVSLSDRFQAASCTALDLKPRLRLHLAAHRSTRGAFPRLRAEYLPREGDANISRLSAILPNSELLENAHFRTICTRVQFTAGPSLGSGCPKGSIYGYVKAWTPLLDEPLQGPVYLRSSNHELPDMVLALHGLVDIEAVARIDSVHGRIRSTFENIPDAPLSRVVLSLRGGKKSLLVNSTDICRGEHHAKIQVTGQNGKVRGLKPRVVPNCKGGA
jgi:hypothetical protein